MDHFIIIIDNRSMKQSLNKYFGINISNPDINYAKKIDKKNLVFW